MPTCPYCSLTFESRPNRSNKQNSYLWGVVYKLISDEIGHTPEECHEIFKAKFLPRYMVEVADIKETITMSTTCLDIVEFKEYIDKVVRFASEKLSIVIPDPK